MTIPQTNYVLNNEGQKIFVQLSVQEWENFLNEYKKLENMFLLKEKLKNAFREMRQIQKGEKHATTLHDFLYEL